MSEKRYFVNSALYLCDNDLSNTLSIFECADLLNQLTEENEQLKGILKNIVHQIDVTYKKPAPMSFAKVNLSLSEYDKLKEVCFK